MLKLWENPMLSIDDRLEVANGEIERLHGQIDAARNAILREGMQRDELLRVLIGVVIRCERRVGGWIGVEDSLPEWAGRDDTPCFIEGKQIGATLTSEKVLVAIAPDNVVRIDNLVSLEGSGHSLFDTYGKRVTHWMMLPEAPNAEVSHWRRAWQTWNRGGTDTGSSKSACGAGWNAA